MCASGNVASSVVTQMDMQVYYGIAGKSRKSQSKRLFKYNLQKNCFRGIRQLYSHLAILTFAKGVRVPHPVLFYTS